MPMDKEILQKIRKELDKKIKNWKCESCGKDTWMLSDHFLALSASKELGVFHGESQFPKVVMICSNCGHSRFYNLEVLGIYDEILKEIKNKKKEGIKEDKL